MSTTSTTTLSLDTKMKLFFIFYAIYKSNGYHRIHLNYVMTAGPKSMDDVINEVYEYYYNQLSPEGLKEYLDIIINNKRYKFPTVKLPKLYEITYKYNKLKNLLEDGKHPEALKEFEESLDTTLQEMMEAIYKLLEETDIKQLSDDALLALKQAKDSGDFIGFLLTFLVYGTSSNMLDKSYAKPQPGVFNHSLEIDFKINHKDFFKIMSGILSLVIYKSGDIRKIINENIDELSVTETIIKLGELFRDNIRFKISRGLHELRDFAITDDILKQYGFSKSLKSEIIYRLYKFSKSKPRKYILTDTLLYQDYISKNYALIKRLIDSTLEKLSAIYDDDNMIKLRNELKRLNPKDIVTLSSYEQYVNFILGLFVLNEYITGVDNAYYNAEGLKRFSNYMNIVDSLYGTPVTREAYNFAQLHAKLDALHESLLKIMIKYKDVDFSSKGYYIDTILNDLSPIKALSKFTQDEIKQMVELNLLPRGIYDFISKYKNYFENIDSLYNESEEKKLSILHEFIKLFFDIENKLIKPKVTTDVLSLQTLMKSWKVPRGHKKLITVTLSLNISIFRFRAYVKTIDSDFNTWRTINITPLMYIKRDRYLNFLNKVFLNSLVLTELDFEEAIREAIEFHNERIEQLLESSDGNKSDLINTKKLLISNLKYMLNDKKDVTFVVITSNPSLYKLEELYSHDINSIGLINEGFIGNAFLELISTYLFLLPDKISDMDNEFYDKLIKLHERATINKKSFYEASDFNVIFNAFSIKSRLSNPADFVSQYVNSILILNRFDVELKLENNIKRLSNTAYRFGIRIQKKPVSFGAIFKQMGDYDGRDIEVKRDVKFKYFEDIVQPAFKTSRSIFIMSVLKHLDEILRETKMDSEASAEDILFGENRKHLKYYRRAKNKMRDVCVTNLNAIESYENSELLFVIRHEETTPYGFAICASSYVLFKKVV